MTDNTYIDNAWKYHEENAEDNTPEPDNSTEKLSRHAGQMETEMGGKSVSELMESV